MRSCAATGCRPSRATTPTPTPPPSGPGTAGTGPATSATATTTDTFYFAGRTSDWLRVDGENFAATPVERIIERFPGVGVGRRVRRARPALGRPGDGRRGARRGNHLRPGRLSLPTWPGNPTWERSGRRGSCASRIDPPDGDGQGRSQASASRAMGYDRPDLVAPCRVRTPTAASPLPTRPSCAPLSRPRAANRLPPRAEAIGSAPPSPRRRSSVCGTDCLKLLLAESMASVI